MTITFLGTGTSQGIPVIACTCNVCQSQNPKDKRLRSSIHIQLDQQSLVIDTGPDFRQQLLRENITTLDGILYTHEHKDHTGGLDDVRAFNYKDKKAMPVYAEQRVLNSLKNEYQYIFSDYPGVPQIHLNAIQNETFTMQNTSIQPIRVLHKNLPILGYKIKQFAYITDASHISPEELQKLQGVHTLVLNAVRREPHHSHFTLTQALELFQKIKPTQGYITHISHQLGRHEDVSKELPSNIQLAYDGLQLTC